MVKRFELFVMRPLFVGIVVLSGILTVYRHWLWLLAGLAGLFYLGIIGSKLHPLQSARDLANGPIEGPAAESEARALDAGQALFLVGQACTRVGILLGLYGGAACWGALSWPWYASVPTGFVTCIVIGSLLKVSFRLAGCR